MGRADVTQLTDDLFARTVKPVKDCLCCGLLFKVGLRHLLHKVVFDPVHPSVSDQHRHTAQLRAIGQDMSGCLCDRALCF